MLLSITILLFNSCGPRKIGHGVLLWSEEESRLATGTYLWILSESRIRDTYTVMTPEDKVEIEVPKWRIRFFDKEQEALDYQTGYEPFISYFGVCERAGHAMRAEMTASAERVYKLRENQEVKILRRSEEKEVIGSWEEYWFQVLTEDGYTGWTYGSYVAPYSTDVNADAIVEEEEVNPLVTNFLNSTWRPEYFESMITQKTIDLELFRPDIGLFPNEETKTITLNLPKQYLEVTYQNMAKLGYNHYIAMGTNMQIHFYGDSRISIQYSYNGREYAEVFVRLTEDVEETILKEKTRRQVAYNALTSKGNLLKSTAYGSITFEENNQFQWNDYQRLVPDVIPQGLTGKGFVRFDAFLSSQMKLNYQGALTMYFESLTGSEEVVFMYNFTSSGIQLVYVPEKNRRGKTVLEEAFSPTVIFLNYAEQ